MISYGERDRERSGAAWWGFCLAASLLAVLGAHAPALAWGSKGHQWSTDNAAELLPEGVLKTYMEAHRRTLAYNCLVPDFQLKDGVGGKLEGPDHYIDLEVIAATPTLEALPRTRLDAGRLYTERGLSYASGGFLPWRIEEAYWALVNALRCDEASVSFCAGLLAHYVADATQPLHTTVHYDGLVTEGNPPTKEFKGIHAEYEITFIEDCGFEFRQSSLALAQPATPIADVHVAVCETILDSFGKVGAIYDAAREHQGADKYVGWEQALGPMTREQLARASTLLSSLWLTAWQAAGSPSLAPDR